jgi:predicted Zn-dependent protease
VTNLKNALLACAFAGVLAVTSGCTTAPAGGGPILAAGSVEDDVRTGREAHPQILAKYGGSVDNSELERYVQRVGTRLENVSELSQLDFTFTVLDSEIVNAFALPGGYVYVSRGLLALAEDEAELAGVIGHEIGHVTARHSAARQTAGGLLTGGLGVLGTLAGAYLGGEQGAQLLGQLGQQAGFGLTQTYSRSQEFEADKLGVRYLGRAGYDTTAMADFLEALQTSAELQARKAGTSLERSTIDNFFSSHPYTPDRVDEARELAIAQGGTGGERDPDALLDAIDGMIYGPSPAQGFVMGQRFAHPELRLAFTYPDGYELSNQPQAVIGRGDNQLLIFDIGEAEGGGPRQYLENVWLPKANMQNVRTFRTEGGLDAAVGYAQVQLSGRPAEGGFVVLQGQGKTVYRFALLTGRFGDAQERDLMATADSFERLTTAEAAELKPQRVRLVTVREGDTVDTFARQMAVDALPRETFITLNGLDRGQILAAGERVKIVARD